MSEIVIPEKYESYFEEFAHEDKEHILTICETASKLIYDRFRARFDDPRLLAACFSKIFNAFLNKLQDLQNDYSEFQINICDRLSIGYSTTSDDDDEKNGNFMISIIHLNSNKKNDNVDDTTSKTEERAVQWNTENIVVQPELLRKISIDAVEQLKTIDVNIGTSELIIPIFITTYESIVNYLKIKRAEDDAFEFEINFVSCFYIGCREAEDDLDDIYIRPNIESKLKLKNDSKASSQYE